MLFYSLQYSVHLPGLSAMHTNKLQTRGSHEDCCHIWSFQCTTLSSFWKKKTCRRRWYYTRNLQFVTTFLWVVWTPFCSSRPTFSQRWLWVIRRDSCLNVKTIKKNVTAQWELNVVCLNSMWSCWWQLRFSENYICREPTGHKNGVWLSFLTEVELHRRLRHCWTYYTGGHTGLPLHKS